jgi:hypothetical protein
MNFNVDTSKNLLLKLFKKIGNRWLHSQTRKLFRSLYPDLPEQYLPASLNSSYRTEQQQHYSTKYLAYLEWLQSTGDTPSSSIHLTFQPIAKNIRLLGTALHDGVKQGTSVTIASGNPSEDAFLQKLKLGQWNPWLWSRISPREGEGDLAGQDDTSRAWQTLFEPLNSRISPSPEALLQKPGLNLQWMNCRSRLILEMAACVRYVFQINQAMRSYVMDQASRIGWRDDERKLAIHLRRGDAASEDLQQRTRTSFTLEDYLQEADIFHQNYGLSTIYLSTESQFEIEKAKILRPQYKFLSLDHDRAVFPRLAETELIIEIAALRNSTIVEPIVKSAIADLYFIGHCDAFIGTFNSEFSLLAWLICIGEKGYIMPYKDLVPKRQIHFFQGRLNFRGQAF